MLYTNILEEELITTSIKFFIFFFTKLIINRIPIFYPLGWGFDVMELVQKIVQQFHSM